MYVSDVPLLQEHPKFLQKLRNEALDGPLTIKKIDELRSMITRFYLEKGLPFVEVVVPEQPVSSGYIQILVTESRLGEIKTEGNQHFSDHSLISHISCEPGEKIHLPSLLNDLDWLNRNPFRRSEAVFTPGEDPGTTNIILKTADRRPILFYGGADNTGTKETGYARFYGGFRYGNLFGLGQLLSYQFTTSTSVSKFQSHALDYQIPLPWKNYLNFFGGWSQAKPDFEHPHMHSKGTSWQVSTRYEMPLNHNPHFAQTLLVGADFKRTNNDLSGGESHQSPARHRTADGRVGYGRRGGRMRVVFISRSLWHPGNIDSNNTTKEFRKLQPGAVATYFYGWANLVDVQSAPMLARCSGWDRTIRQPEFTALGAA